MTNEAFAALLEDRLRSIRQQLECKASEYASAQDRLHNFKAAASFLRCTPARALLGFWTKHIISLSDMVHSEKPYTADVWNEKIGDAINYLILLEAIVKES